MYEALRSIALSHWESQLAPEAVALEFRMLLMSLLMLLTIVHRTTIVDKLRDGDGSEDR